MTARAAGGTGNPDIGWYSAGPTSFAIGNADELAGLASLVNGGNDFNGKTITLTDDIDLSSYSAGTGWAPIGNSLARVFNGTFDGAGHVVSNLKINNSSDYCVGLFGYIDMGGTVENVGVASGSITGNSCVGGVAGFSNGTIQNCRNAATVSGSSNVGDVYVGGVTGYNNGTVQYCCNTGAVSGNGAVGGVAGVNGYSSSGTIQNCYNTGTVTATGTETNAGGVVGGNGSSSINSGTVQYCYNTGAVTATVTGNNVGSVAGVSLTDSGTVTACFYDSNSSGVAYGIGLPQGDTGATNEITSAMQAQSTFTDADWDFSTVWFMPTGDYPKLTMPVCEIAETGTIYTTLDAAVTDANAATGDQTIRLLADISVTSTLNYVGRNTIILDLNGHTLEITTSGTDNGINAVGSLKIEDTGTGGALTITSDGDGIITTADVTIESGTVTITSGGNGIITGNDVTIDGGAVYITSAGIGIDASGSLTITGTCTLNITASGSGSDGYGIYANGGVTIDGSTNLTINSGGDGINTGGDVTIKSGTVDITTHDYLGGGGGSGIAAANASAGVVTISGGLLTISATDFGIMAGTALKITGGRGTINGGGGQYYAVSCGNNSTASTAIKVGPGVLVTGVNGAAAKPGVPAGQEATFVDTGGNPFSNIQFGPAQVVVAPASLIVKAGQDAVFSVTAGGYPAPTCQWQVSADNGGTWSNISGATSAKLTLTNVPASDNDNQYRCIATNTAGSATSNAATLTVTVTGPSTVTLSATGGTYTNNSITLTATVGAGVQGQGGQQGQAYKPAPTGTITFMEGDTILGTRTLNRYGTATFTVASPIDEGNYTFAAEYSGDDLYDGAVSDPCTVDVTAFLSVSSLSLHFGAAGGTQQLQLVCNSTWSLDNSASWLTTSVSGFKADNPDILLNVTATANPDAAQRTALLTLSIPGVMIKTVSVTQDAGVNPATGMEAAGASPVIVYSQGGKAFVKSDTPIRSVEVYDISGKLLKQVKGSSNFIEISGLPKQQVLVVKVTCDGERVTSYKVKIEN